MAAACRAGACRAGFLREFSPRHLGSRWLAPHCFVPFWRLHPAATMFWSLPFERMDRIQKHFVLFYSDTIRVLKHSFFYVFSRPWRVQGAPGSLLESFPPVQVPLRLHGAELWTHKDPQRKEQELIYFRTILFKNVLSRHFLLWAKDWALCQPQTWILRKNLALGMVFKS